MMRLATALLCLAAVGNASAQGLRAAPYAPTLAAVVLDPDVAEISGMAASHRADGVLWVHNDSGNGTVIYALGDDGRVRSEVTVAGVGNHDWEDLAGWERGGESFLLIGDTGDNGGLRREIELIALAEPDPAVREQTIEPLWRLRVRWPDGPRDCEGIAIDVNAGRILLMSKRRVPAQLFAVPLGPPPAANAVVTAEQIASVMHIPQPTTAELERYPQFGRFRAQITAMDVSPDGRLMALLTYRDGYLLRRAPGESWRDALLRRPEKLGLPPLPQGEAIAFGRDGRTLWVGSERLPAPLIRLDPK
jgi:hypothetical protein